MDNLQTLEGCFQVLNLPETASDAEIRQAMDAKLEELRQQAATYKTEGRLTDESTQFYIDQYTETRAAGSMLLDHRDKFDEAGKLKEGSGEITELADFVLPDEIRALSKPTDHEREGLFGAGNRT